MTDDLDQLTQLLVSTSRAIRGHLAKTRDGTCSPLRISTLWHVRERRAPLMKEIAADLGVSPSTATPVINGLVREGCLRKKTDPRDGRAMRLQLTPKGRRLLQQGIRARTEAMTRILSALDRRDRERLRRVLVRLSETFKD